MSIRDRVQSGTCDEGWTIHVDGSLRYRGRVLVPQLTDLREEILREFHSSRFAVHPGGMKMYQDLRHQYYWNGLKRHVGDFVQRCLTCKTRENSNFMKNGKMVISVKIQNFSRSRMMK